MWELMKANFKTDGEWHAHIVGMEHGMAYVVRRVMEATGSSMSERDMLIWAEKLHIKTDGDKIIFDEQGGKDDGLHR
mgnify:CR=1 FL=1